MRIRTYSQSLSISLMRRVIGPSSVLSQRGQHVHYQIVGQQGVTAFQPAGYDLILLPNWAYLGPMPAAPGRYIYDLSDVALLDDARCLHVIRQCAGVTVATEAAAALVKPYCAHVRVQPSLVHADWLLTSPAAKQGMPLALLLARDARDVAPLVEPIGQWLEQCANVRLASDDPSLVQALVPTFGKRVVIVEPDLMNYPTLLRSAFLLLLPGEDPARDPAPALEAGLVGTPSLLGTGFAASVPEITGLGVLAHTPGQWYQQLVRLTEQDAVRARLATSAQRVAQTMSAARGATHWLGTLSRFAQSPAPRRAPR